MLTVSALLAVMSMLPGHVFLLWLVILWQTVAIVYLWCRGRIVKSESLESADSEEEEDLIYISESTLAKTRVYHTQRTCGYVKQMKHPIPLRQCDKCQRKTDWSGSSCVKLLFIIYVRFLICRIQDIPRVRISTPEPYRDRIKLKVIVSFLFVDALVFWVLAKGKSFVSYITINYVWFLMCNDEREMIGNCSNKQNIALYWNTPENNIFQMDLCIHNSSVQRHANSVPFFRRCRIQWAWVVEPGHYMHVQ